MKQASQNHRGGGGGGETVWVKRQVPWPQNFVLGGNNKSRIYLMMH